MKLQSNICDHFIFLGRWYEDNEPESIAIPDYENRIIEQVMPFLRDKRDFVGPVTTDWCS